MLVDANILLFASDTSSPFYERASEWLNTQLTGPQRVGLPWESLEAFLRVSTHARLGPRPLSPETAWHQIENWLSTDVAWIPVPTDRHPDVLRSLVVGYQLRGKLIPDARLAALAIEHGLTLCSADTDFARFREIEWVNPLAA
ncbi:MAG TPA: TA system VapC family ribonuclease toxin [Gaiellaceae bacterium]|nr:TA system VapC family ribonuclease toxin [Gaiellaceae bacterium]